MTRRLEANDLLKLAYVSDPQLSDDGTQAAAVVTHVLPAPNGKPPRYQARVLVGPAARGRLRPFTQTPFGATTPRFSPSGDRIAFLGKTEADAPAQIHVLPLDGGESRAITRAPAGATDFVWFPDGGRLVYVGPAGGTDAAAKNGAPRRITRLRYRADGVGFLPEVPAQLYLVAVGGGRSRRLTDLPQGAAAPAMAPDGQAVYFLSADDADEADAFRQALYRLELAPDGRPGKLTRLTEHRLGMGRPVPSPSGTRIAFLAPSTPDDSASPTGVWQVDAEGGEARLLTGGRQVDQAIAGDTRYGTYPLAPAWDGEDALIFVLAEEGTSTLARVAVDGGIMRWGVEERVVTSFAFRNGLALFTAETPDQPGELFLRGPRDEEVQRSRVNAAWCRRFPLRAISEVRELSTDADHTVPYWTMSPPRTRRDHALVLQVHGGPHVAYGHGFVFEFQLLASHGYTVVFGNPRGGGSYGPEFMAAVLEDYGGGDARDVLAIADDALAQHRDPAAPMHLTGGSYGGFMTNWLVGHTDRFRSAVTQRSISNWLSFYGTSDIGPRFTEREIGGRPWSEAELLWSHSPLKYAEVVVTPTLIMHAEDDARCPIEQGEQWFTALKRLGKAEVELMRFPGEGHELSRSGRPDRRVARLEAILDWFTGHA